MITATIERVEKNTTAAVNEKIRLQTQASIARYAKAGAPAIRRRLRELDREWDIERYLETMAPEYYAFWASDGRGQKSAVVHFTGDCSIVLSPARPTGLVPADSDPPPIGRTNHE